jgi:aminoglycoside phosphotransferase (APT) family kinase protein
VPGFTDEEIRAAATSIRPNAPVERVEKIDPGKNTVYAVAYADRETILKIGTGSPERVRAEPAIVEHVSTQTTVPVPTVVTSGEDALSTPYTLFERVGGKTVADLSPELSTDTLEQVMVEGGRHLGELHAATEFDSVGRLISHETALRPETPDTEWSSLLEQAMTAKIDQLGDAFDPYRADLEAGIECVLADWTPPSRVDPVLAHMDYRPANLAFSPDEEPVTNAVLDWAGASAVPPAYELAHVEALTMGLPHTATGDRFREQFRAGYCEARGVDTVPEIPTVYRIDAQLRLSKHLELIADTRSDTSIDTVVAEHLDEFRELGVLD